ncbi:MAG: FmdB family zinc ribbon protein [Aquiluna sp.]
MPTYAYVCRACDHAFEIQQTFSEKPLTSCPKCSGELRKQFGTLGVSFKGSGFYRTDSQSAKCDSTSSSSSSD